MSKFLGSVSVCRVACLILVCLVGLSSTLAADCAGQTDPCQGKRPRLPNGCCPGVAGEDCLPLFGFLCDHDLGYSCLDVDGRAASNSTGQCKGRYNLRAIDREKTSVTIAWTAFAPLNYEYEYVLLLRRDSYHYDVNKWEQIDCGTEVHYTVHNLSPATLYLIKVAVWSDGRAFVLGNVSETLLVSTQGVEYCDIEEIESRVNVGDYMAVGGEDNCTCLPTGQLDCKPLCPEVGMPELREGCRIYPKEESCDYTVVCPVLGESCTVDNVTFAHGSELETGCQICTCDDGHVECDYPPECPYSDPPVSCLQPKVAQVDDNCCPQWECDDQCVYENKTYNDGEFFTSSQCGLCQCNATEGVQCSADCPPVELVMPDAACPDPHIRMTECCDTLHCFDPNMDPFAFVYKVYAMSYSPVTVTLSFVVETESEVEEEGVPNYCHYEISYANSSAVPARWENVIVHPVDVSVLADEDAIMKPREALTKDSAIVVDMRAYVTLSGMHPNTTYYVDIKKIDVGEKTEDMATVHADGLVNVHSAMIVVKTRPLQNITSCFHSGREVFHGDLVPSECSKTCRCLHGQVRCQSTCPSQELVVLPSSSCPHPRLERQKGECCLHWHCYPTESGCLHNGIILEAGQTVSDGCDECTCLNSSVTCVSLCPSADFPPRPECVLAHINGQCCTQWACPRGERSPIAFKRSLRMIFIGQCSLSTNNFKRDLVSRFQDYISHLVDCSNKSVEVDYICHRLKIEVDCFETSSPINYKDKRSLSMSSHSGNIIVLIISLVRNFSSTNETSPTHDINLSMLKLRDLLNTSFDLHLTDGTVMQSTQNIHLENLNFICPAGFFYVKGKCVLSEIEFKDSPSRRVGLVMVNVTSISALIQWQPLKRSLQDQLEYLKIKYRANGSRAWSTTEAFQPWVTTCVLSGLSPDTSYTVKLEALSCSNKNNKWTLGDMMFQTLSFSGVIPESLRVTQYQTSETSVILIWDPFSPDLLDHIKSITVIYGKSSPNSSRKDITVHGAPLANLTDLSPGDHYKVSVQVLLFSGEVIKSKKMDLKTYLAQHSPKKELMIALVIICVIMCVVSAAVFCLCLVLCYRKKSNEGSNRGFENKTFGIQLDNGSDINPNATTSST